MQHCTMEDSTASYELQLPASCLCDLAWEPRLRSSCHSRCATISAPNAAIFSLQMASAARRLACRDTVSVSAATLAASDSGHCACGHKNTLKAQEQHVQLEQSYCDQHLHASTIA
jgi:hypothetical protein